MKNNFEPYVNVEAHMVELEAELEEIVEDMQLDLLMCILVLKMNLRNNIGAICT